MTESTQSSGTSETPDQTTANERARESDTLANFRKILSEDAGGSQEGDAGGSPSEAKPEEGKPKGKPKKFNDLAGRLEGVELDDLYKLEVATAKDGSPVTVEALKDLYAKQDDFTVRELALAEKEAKREAEWTREQAEFAQLVSMLDQKAITPQVQEKVRQKVEMRNKQERGLILKHIPEWQDPTVREAELGAMVDYLKDFGIHESFLTATVSHKLFRMVRAATLQQQRVRKALESVVPVKKPSTTGKSGGGLGAPKKPSASQPRSNGHGGMQERFRQILEQGT